MKSVDMDHILPCEKLPLLFLSAKISEFDSLLCRLLRNTLCEQRAVSTILTTAAAAVDKFKRSDFLTP